MGGLWSVGPAATPTDKLTVALDTLINPTTVGTDVAGPMANFDPTQSYSWLAAQWSGIYSGPTDVATLDAATSFDTSGFLNPVAGTFGWSLDPADQELSLVYTPSAVPEPGSLALIGAATVAAGWRLRRGLKPRATPKPACPGGLWDPEQCATGIVLGGRSFRAGRLR
jgi:hypothetical protein